MRGLVTVGPELLVDASDGLQAMPLGAELHQRLRLALDLQGEERVQVLADSELHLVQEVSIDVVQV